MKRSEMRRKSIQAINKRGILLVYPLANRAEPRSLWSELFPRSQMRWEWDSGGDTRVADLWYLREELSRSREVMYAKWFQGRATLFSRPVFTHLLAYLSVPERRQRLTRASDEALAALEADSPLSTKQLKAAIGLEGRLMEAAYNRALKPLWSNLLITAFGEFDDSSFPSLGIGATATLFEDEWAAARDITPEDAEVFLRETLGDENPFWKFARKTKKLT
jgi:hypothetical protein